jgi:hypothetical protein
MIPVPAMAREERRERSEPERERRERSRGERDTSFGSATAAAVAPRRISRTCLSRVGGPPPGVWGESPRRNRDR